MTEYNEYKGAMFGAFEERMEIGFLGPVWQIVHQGQGTGTYTVE